MTTQDREWVKSMIETAALQTFDKVSDKIREIPENCPVIAKMRIGLIGIGIGLLLAGGSFGAVVMNLVK